MSLALHIVASVKRSCLLRGTMLVGLLLLLWPSAGLVDAQTLHSKSGALIIPGQSFGEIKIGMSHDQVIKAVGKPAQDSPGLWLEYKEPGSLTDIFFQNGVVAEIRFNSKNAKTADGLNLSNYNQKKWHDRYKYSRLQWRFMNTRQILAGGGLAIYHLNLDSTDPKSPIETLALVYAGDPFHEPIALEGHRDGGWHDWDGSGSSLWDTIESEGSGGAK